ncbi:MAG: single-stranded DNA-binding protein [Verrucomicrobiota bacterium]|nr:single-stranded DNA-binding protein [Verrucomicrobiota bacterium]
MASLNKVLLIGNLTRDPELRYTPKGTAVADIGMAISRTYKTQDGQDREEVCFVTVEVWGRQAETAGQYLSKGSPVFIEGELKFESWTNKEGKKQSSLKVRAERVQFLGRPKNAEYKDGNAAPKQTRNQDHESSGTAASTSFEEAPASDDDDIPF